MSISKTCIIFWLWYYTIVLQMLPLGKLGEVQESSLHYFLQLHMATSMSSKKKKKSCFTHWKQCQLGGKVKCSNYRYAHTRNSPCPICHELHGFPLDPDLTSLQIRKAPSRNVQSSTAVVTFFYLQQKTTTVMDWTDQTHSLWLFLWY